MFSDFDLSFRCAVNPTLLKSSFPGGEPTKRLSGHCTEFGCTNPFCLQPSWVQMLCFSLPSNTQKLKHDSVSQVNRLLQLVAEPTDAQRGKKREMEMGRQRGWAELAGARRGREKEGEG
ncbi:hypothetical protein AAC387_Pa01g3093 [Persea americana]